MSTTLNMESEELCYKDLLCNELIFNEYSIDIQRICTAFTQTRHKLAKLGGSTQVPPNWAPVPNAGPGNLATSVIAKAPEKNLCKNYIGK